VAYQSPNKDISFRNRLIGDGLVFFGAVFYAMYTVGLKIYFNKFPVIKEEKKAPSIEMESKEALEDKKSLLSESEGTKEEEQPNGVGQQHEIELEDEHEQENKLEEGSKISPNPDSTAKKPLSSLALLFWVSVVGWACFVPFSFVEKPWNYSWTWDVWAMISFLALLSTALSYAIYGFGVEKIGATRTAVFANFVPVFGVLSAWMFFGERIGWIHGVSLLLVWTGVLLVNYKK
jgi:drug/metabolite transporter (DMT)-like permease